jgi:YHS domain-containing protein
MFDNRAGNSTGIVGVHDYCHLFRTLQTPYYKVIGNDTTNDSLADTLSALWVCMMGHQTSAYKQQNGGKRYFFFSDNFYTKHTIAEALHKFTDSEAHLIGTVKFNNVDATNRYHLSKGMELLKNFSSWCLVFGASVP